MSTEPAAAALRRASFILKRVNQAIREFAMIRDGDRIAVAVSGGKDSLALCWLLRLLQRTGGTSFEIAAIHVLGDALGVTEPHLPLIDWLAAEEFSLQVVKPDLPSTEALPLSCQRCAWLRRKALFGAAGTLGCNAIAFAHHADDAAQTTLLNLLYGGKATTFAPVAHYFDRRFRLIRPLLYVPESDLRRLARLIDAPTAPPLCPQAANSRRERVAGMLRMLGRDYLSQARTNLIRAGLRGRDEQEDDAGELGLQGGDDVPMSETGESTRRE